MAVKIKRLGYDHDHVYLFFCPGCGHCHPFDKRWTFNGDYEKPTFHPSLLVDQHDPSRRCHLWLREGTIQYLSDSHHSMAGHTVTCPDWKEDCF